MERCGRLINANPKKFGFLLEKLEAVVTFDKNAENGLPLLENLGFGTVANLNKNKKQTMPHINFLNNLLIQPESVTYLNQCANVKDILQATLPKIFQSRIEAVKKKKLNPKSPLDSKNNEVGFFREGNSCFIISSLQLLFHLDSFVSITISSQVDNERSWMFTIQKILNEFLSKKNTVDPKIVVSKILIDEVMKEFRNDNLAIIQSDVCEFIDVLLSQLPENIQDVFPCFKNTASNHFLTFLIENLKNKQFSEIVEEVFMKSSRKHDNMPQVLLLNIFRWINLFNL